MIYHVSFVQSEMDFLSSNFKLMYFDNQEISNVVNPFIHQLENLRS